MNECSVPTDDLLRLRLERAIEQAFVSDHPSPSASQIGHCLLQQWFAGKGIEPSDPKPIASILRMEGGREFEGVWDTVLRAAGLLIIRPVPRVEWNGISGQADALVLGPDRHLWVLEFKSLSVFSYLDLTKKGVRESHPAYYSQIQVYIQAYAAERGLLLAVPADWAAMGWHWKLAKRDGTPPPFYMEWIEPDMAEVAEAIERARLLAKALEEDEVPVRLREYDPDHLLRIRGFPCSWCDWRSLCLKS